MAETFQQLVRSLPENLQRWLVAQELTDAKTVTDSVGPKYLEDTDGNVIVKPMEIVFVECVMAAVQEVKPCTRAHAKTINFFRKCYKQCNEVPCVLGAAKDAMPLAKRHKTCQDSMED